MNKNLLHQTIQQLTSSGKGILAADESAPTIKKRFDKIHVESTEKTRQTYRSMLLASPHLGNYISGVILFEETLKQKTDDGILLPTLLEQQGIVPGIKVDKGLTPFESSPEEKITQGTDGLTERLAEYKAFGARFAKWRAVYQINDSHPSRLLIKTNAELLARYAAVCQSLDIVPIVEPEVLIDGDHTIEQCAQVTEKVQHAVFRALYKHGVLFEFMLLKPNMITAGKESPKKNTPEQVAEHTLRIFRRTVPAAVPSINFLSGGQTCEEATANLNAINQTGNQPWYLSFSFARALQDPCMKTWQGKAENIKLAQEALLKRAKLNSAAIFGEYNPQIEKK